MKIKEILIIEEGNFESINLFKEGLFWRCYEYSAWMFVENIKHYRVLKKYVKAVKQDIVYLGFPESVLDAILNEIKEGCYKEMSNDKKIVIKGYQLKEGFEQWKSEIPVVAVNKKTDNQFELIIEKIKNYPVANRTPVEALEFLSNIQKEINEYH